MPEASAYEQVLTRFANEKLAQHAAYIVEHGEDMPEIQGWSWQGINGAAGAQGGE